MGLSQQEYNPRSPMDLSICVLTHNQPVLLARCAAACIEEMGKAPVNGEIIVVDNASADGYPRILQESLPKIRVIRNEQNLGFSAANNQAIRASSGRFVLILNDDAVLLPNSLRLMIGKLESDPRVAAVGPQLLNSDGSLQRHFTNRRFPHVRGILCSMYSLEDRLSRRPLTRALFTLDRDPARSREAEHLAGACLLVRRSALDQVGLFDESYHYWFEDVDLCYRLKNAGWKLIYLAEARVMHYGSASIQKIDEAHRRKMFLTSLRKFYVKNMGRIRLLLLNLSLALLHAFRGLRLPRRDDRAPRGSGDTVSP